MSSTPDRQFNRLRPDHADQHASKTGGNLIAISVGNTRTQIGLFEAGELKSTHRGVNSEPEALLGVVADWWKKLSAGNDAAILLASVNDPVANALSSSIEDQTNEEVYRVGDDVEIPIGVQLDPETITGVDRLLNAAAAFDRLKQACVIIDAGTAITVDFVDGDGTFHGGAIAPGANMQMHAMHQHTAALPELKFQTPPQSEPFGRNTAQAMYRGVYHGIRGMVQHLIEQYAEAFGAFPMVIATGGDALMLFENDPLIDRIVPDLTLMGIAAASRFAVIGEAGLGVRKDQEDDS